MAARKKRMLDLLISFHIQMQLSKHKRSLRSGDRNRKSRLLQIAGSLQVDRCLPIKHRLIPIDVTPHRSAPDRRIRKRAIRAAVSPIVRVYDDRNRSTHECNIQPSPNPSEDLYTAETEGEDEGEETPQGCSRADSEHSFPFAVNGETVMAEFVDEVSVDGEDKDGSSEGETMEDGGGKAEQETTDAHFEGVDDV